MVGAEEFRELFDIFGRGLGLAVEECCDRD
jgi:hypothetical protein